MKYFIIFSILFLFISPAYAAKTVKGTVPVVQPLQPPAAGVHPDYQNNFQSRPAQPQQQAGSSAAAGSNPQQSQSTNESQSPASSETSSVPAKPNFLVLLFIIFIGVVALGWVWLKQKKQ